MASSYVYSANHPGVQVNLGSLVGNPNPETGILKISNVVQSGTGYAYANPELAISATLLDAGDYMPGSTTLVGVETTIVSLGGGGLLVGTDASPFSAALTVSGGEVGSLLAITQKTPTGELGWVGGAPADGQFLGYTTLGGIDWQSLPAGGTVTSVNADSATGLLVSVEDTTTTPNIHIELPGSGVSNAVVAGDMLRGGLGAYEPVALGSSGDVWTVSGGQATWEPPLSVESWSTFAATSNVDMANHALIDAQYIILDNLGAPPSIVVEQTYIWGTNNSPIAAYLPAVSAIEYVATYTTAPGANPGSILYGTTTGVDYTNLLLGTAGHVLTVNNDQTAPQWSNVSELQSVFLASDTPGSSQNVGALASGLLKFTTTAGVAVPFTAVAATTSVAGDYQYGSLSLSNLDSLGNLPIGTIIYGSGDASYWNTLAPSSAGSILYLAEGLGPVLQPAWGPLGAENTLLASVAGLPQYVGGTAADGQFLGYTTLGGIEWQAIPEGANWSTITATESPDIGGNDITNLQILYMNPNEDAPAIPVSGGALAVGSDSGAGLYFAAASLDPLQFHQVVTADGGGSYGTLGSLLVGNGNTVGDYTPLNIGTNGQVLTVSGGTASWAAPATSGTVTSVGLTSTGNSLDITGTPNPITGSGAFNVEIKTTNSPTNGDVLSVSNVSPLDLTWVAPSGGFAWVSVSGTTQAMAANTGYFANNASPTTFTLPASPTLGDVYEIVGPSLWSVVTENVGQAIAFGSTFSGGSVGWGATQGGDTIRLVCSDATPGSEVFRVLSSVGNLVQI